MREPGSQDMPDRRLNANAWFKGATLTLASFAVLGTVAALWETPFFMRMTPAGAIEIALLALTAALLGLYVAIRRSACSVKSATAGGVLGFIGVACPVCNKLLVLLIGSELLLTYFEPVRVFVAAAGVVILALAIAREWTLQRKAAVSAMPAD